MKNSAYYLTICLFYSVVMVLSTSWMCSTVVAETQNVLTQTEIDNGWIQLFDGRTLFGWAKETEVNWKVTDGEITSDEGKVGLLRTNSEFSDYIFSVDFRSAKGTNSGIFLRTTPKPSNPKKGCYELNIADDGDSPFPTGSIVAHKKISEKHDTQDWQNFQVHAIGDQLTIYLDGKKVLTYKDARPILRGHIGLQFNRGKIAFRNIKLKPLSLETIFNGKDLTGWKPYSNATTSFTVDDKKSLHVKGGKGQLETLAKYGDFVFQADIRSNGKASNSGLFFRSIPGENTNGYECQLQHSYGTKEKKNLIDCGTGGICRRQLARRIVAKDFKWFKLTLIATGPHIATWVNGYQVADWTDTRKLNKNPRRGKRLTPGTLILQAHDKTTDYSFRKIQAMEMPKGK